VTAGNEIDAFLDKDSERVLVEADVDSDGLDQLLPWLLSVSRWLKKRQEHRDGGRRWVFERPVGGKAVARFMAGKLRLGRNVELERHNTRKPWRCDACRQDLPLGTPCWRQAPNTWGGYSKARFCEECVQRGGPPRPPQLRLIRGGAAREEQGA